MFSMHATLRCRGIRYAAGYCLQRWAQRGLSPMTTAASSSLDHIGDGDVVPLVFLTGIFRPASWLSCFPDIMSIGTCNTILRRATQDNDFWHNANLELSDHVGAGAAFRQSRFFGKLVAAWASSVRSVTCPHQILHSVFWLDDKIWLQGIGEYLPCIIGPVRTASSTIIRYWRCERHTYLPVSSADAHYSDRYPLSSCRAPPRCVSQQPGE